MDCMATYKIFLVGSSTFALKASNDATIADEIGRAISDETDFFAKNALRISEIPANVYPKIVASEILVLHIGVMDFLPSLKKRLYPCLAVQSKNGFLYEIEYKKNPIVERLLNIYNRVCFNLQLMANLCVNEISPEILESFVSEILEKPESKIKRIFLISPPPVRHPGARHALGRTKTAIQNTKKMFQKVDIIDYQLLTIGLIHDHSGHLIESDRHLFSSRVASTIQETLK